MNLDFVVAQLRTYCPPLAGRADGAADFGVGVKDVIALRDKASNTRVYPVATVLPLEDDAEANVLVNGLQQTVTESIAVVVEFDASGDRRGQAGVDQVEAMKYALHAALLGWYIPGTNGQRATTPMFYGGGQMLDFDRARLFWQYVYRQQIIITDGDGFQISGDPLTDITGASNETTAVPPAPDTTRALTFELLPAILPSP